MVDLGLQLYLTEAKKHQVEYVQQLEELSQDLNNNQFKKRDYLAAERLLQVFIELNIGLAKHCVKKIGKATQIDAYQTFSLLKENGLITHQELNNWRKIIGMRNGLVHDYLNIDITIIESVLANQSYKDLKDFSDKAIQILSS